MKKRTFLLLEVLIAFTLATICVIPLVKQPIAFYKNEMKNLELMELERLADWSFTEVKEELLKNRIAWDEIPKKKALSRKFSLKDMRLQIPTCKDKRVERSFVLKGRGEKKGPHDEIYRIIGIHIFLNHHEYQYRTLVQKLPVKT